MDTSDDLTARCDRAAALASAGGALLRLIPVLGVSLGVVRELAAQDPTPAPLAAATGHRPAGCFPAASSSPTARADTPAIDH
jgi:hypothetical protein